MGQSNDSSAHWWELDVDGPVTLTLISSISLTVVLVGLGFFVGGFAGAAVAAPIGFFVGAALALRTSNHSTMKSSSCFVDRILGRIGIVVFIYASPLWIWMAVRYGLGIVIVVLGGLTAFLWFFIAGTVAVVVALRHIAAYRAA
ncbi:MAG: hypothetical protein DWQ34_20740 [Planctomycetota bacterium]|nr:MAG: hypothetical protein DWQ34_20740 [Planctomycetota bacterium]REK29012.1 MAG: hypothetical protein DWQ41_05565 [Planctomycetota bacterium]REK39557.1 MAG: hypothetical protein DWQ45_01380 [Planctomycetota bacterium]